MTRKDAIIRQLRNMGYIVSESENFIVVMFRGENGTTFSICIDYDELEGHFVIEHIVRTINANLGAIL